MSQQHVSPKSVSRRGFMRAGCLTATAVSLTVCGVSAAAPDQPLADLPAFTYGEAPINNRILIAYASANGSTADIAKTIGETLYTQGFSVDVRPITKDLLVDGYQAVLIGSAIHYGSWLPEAVDFVKSNQEALSSVPVALFCVHIRNLGDDEVSWRGRLAYLNDIRSLLKPAVEGFFAGRFDRRGAVQLLPGWLARFIPPMDFRNWEKIRAWADSLSTLLQQA